MQENHPRVRDFLRFWREAREISDSAQPVRVCKSAGARVVHIRKQAPMDVNGFLVNFTLANHFWAQGPKMLETTFPGALLTNSGADTPKS